MLKSEKIIEKCVKNGGETDEEGESVRWKAAVLPDSVVPDKKRDEMWKDLGEISAIISPEILDFIDSFVIIGGVDNYALGMGADINQ